ncbi:hypothetical protein NB573_09860 [Vibrio alginolyticus]|uniref:tail fiber protein n=1 Tax=Vibrio alginolyticus TaxID=663 RepID=UPI00215C6A08|nr:tail fiber protein [Vibrio alginolyticus]MCR9960347.1 hypothetical protein [Vibrio alginolyticus]
MTIETITLNPRTSDSATLDLITDIQYLEPFTSTSLNRKFCGVVRPGVFRGFSCEPGNGLTLNIKHTQNQDGNEVKYGVALVERDDYLLTVRQQNDIAINIPTGQVMYVVLEAFYKFGVETKQVNLDSDVDSATVRVLPQSQVKDHHVILCTVNIPDSATQLLAEHLSFDGRMLGGYDLDSHLSDTHPHKQYVRNDADSVVNANLRLNDSFKLSLGNNDDLTLLHDGSNSVVESRTGDLFLKQGAAGKSFNLQVKNASGSLVNSVSVVGGANPYVKLRHSNTTRLMTTGGGVAVTGDIIVSGEVHDSGARVFSPNNRNISNSATTVSSTVYASLTAVKTAHDRAVEAESNSKAHTDARISDLLGGAAPEALDTIRELGEALLNQGDAVAVITNNIADHKADKANPHGVTKAQVGLGNVPNYTFTSSVSDSSNTKFAAASAVKKAYDLALTKITKAQGDNYYLARDANAKSASKWETARTITLHGDLSGSVSLDGSANVTLSASVKNDSHTHSYILATDDRDVKPSTTGLDKMHAAKVYFVSLRGMNGERGSSDYQDLMVFDTYTDATGGNVNAITLDKQNGAMRLWSAKGDATAWGTGQRVFADNYHPNADKWTNARTLALTGDVSGSVSFDGSKNVTLNVTVGNDSHTHDTRYHTKSQVNSIEEGLQSQIDNKVSSAPGSVIDDADSLFADGKHTFGTLSNTNPNGLTGVRSILHIQNGSGGFQLAARTQNSEYHIRAAGANDGAIHPWERIYTEGFKPTSDDVGALSINGGTLNGDLIVKDKVRAASFLNGFNDQQGLVTYSGGTTRIGGSGANSIFIAPRGAGKTSFSDYATELDKNGILYVNAASATPINVTRIDGAANVNIKYQGRDANGAWLGGAWYAGSFTNGAGFAFGKVGDLSTASNRYFEIGEGGVGVRTSGSTSGMTIYSDDPAVIFYRNGIGKSGYIGMSGDTDDAFYVRPPSTGARFKVYHEGHRPTTEEVGNQSISLDGLDPTKFYPVVLDANNAAGYVCHIDLSVGAGVGSNPYNNNTVTGVIRGGGWSDANAFFDLIAVKFSNSETNIHSAWEGSQGFMGVVFYVRGGQTIRLRSNSYAKVHTTDFSVGGSVFKAGVANPSATGVVKNSALLAVFSQSGRYVSNYSTQFNTNEIKILPSSQHGVLKIETDSNFDSMIRLAEDNARYGGFIHYNGAEGNEFRLGTRNSDVDVIALRIHRGSKSVHIEDELLAKDLNVSLNGGLKLSGRRAIRSTDSSWIRINDAGDFSGVFFGNSLLRTDGEITVGSWSGSNDSVRMENNFADTSWASNGRAGFSINVKDSSSAHWALASYYDGTNIRAGIQILSNSEGRMRFYTNRRSKYVDIRDGNVYAGSPQSSAGNSLARKDYVDSKLSGVSSRAGEAAVGSGGQLREGNLTIDGITWEYKDWLGHFLDPFDLINYNAPVAGFDIRVEGYYEIEWTSLRRRNASNSSAVYSAIAKSNKIIAEAQSDSNDFDAVPTTCRWVGKLYYGELIQFLDRGASTPIKGSHFSIRYIKP